LTLSRALSYSDDEGSLQDSFLDVRVMVVDADFYRGLRDELQRAFQTGASTILFQMGLGYGKLMAAKIQQMGKGKLSVYKGFIERGKNLGMGSFEVPLLKSLISGLRSETVIRVRQSFFAAAVGDTGKAECHIFRGMMAGAAGALLGREFACVEERCLSKGDGYCEFSLKLSKGKSS
jgi:predicted hydrocarbon binding protein